MKPWLRTLIGILVLAGVYFCAGKLGLSWAYIQPTTSAVWPPAGIAFAALLLFGYGLWPGIFLGAFLVNITTEGALLTTLGIAVGNTLEALLGAWAVNRFANGAKAFERARNIFKFVLFAPILSTVVSATFGVTSLILTGFATWDSYEAIWWTWWLGDAVGNIVIAPLLVIWVTQPFPQWNSKRVVEAAGLLLAVLLIGYWIFLRGISSSPDYAVVLPLLWAAFRFGQHGAVTSALLMSGIALVGTQFGVGPYAHEDPHESLLRLQAFMGTIAAATLVLASVISESKRAQQRLEVQEAVSRVLAESPTLKEAVPQIVQVLCERARWDWGALWNLDRSANELHCIEVWHMPAVQAPQFEAATKAHCFAPGVGLPGRVWATGEAAWIADVTTDSNFPRVSAAIKEGLHGAFGFPIKLGDEIIGVIECFSCEVREPDDYFLQIVSDIGRQIGQFMERKRAEDDLRAQRIQLRMITDVTPLMLAQCSRDLRYDYVNRAYAAVFNLMPEQIIGRPILEILGAEAYETVRAHVETVLQGTPVEFEQQVQFPRIGNRFLRAIYLPDKDERGHIRGWIASISDITERKQAETEIATLNKQMAADLAARTRLQQLSTRLVQAHDAGSLLQDILDVGIEITDADMGNLQLFERERRALKIVAQRGFERPFLEFFDSVHNGSTARGSLMQLDARIIVEDVTTSPIFVDTPEGEAMLAAGAKAVQSTLLVSRSGRVVGMLATYYRKPRRPTDPQLTLLDLLARQAADFIERTQTEGLLHHSEERLRAVVETAVDGIITMDERGTILTVNPAAERIFKYPVAEMLGQSLRMLMAQPYDADRDSYISNYLHKGHKKTVGIGREVVGQRKGGETFSLDLAVSETRIGDQRIFTGIVRDISEHKRADELLRRTKDELVKTNEELERRVQARTADLEKAHAALLSTIAEQKNLEEQLRHAQKMESIGTLAGGIAHDFNNILNIIRGYATLIGQQPAAQQQIRESVKVIDQEIDRGASVVRQLLTMARKTETRLAPANLNNIVLTLRELIKTFPKTIAVELDLDPRPALVSADPNKMSQALLNICVNARDAMPAGGQLTIKTKVVDAQTIRQHHVDAVADEWVCVVISDTGMGMREEVRGRIFEPFFTTKGVGEGTGLGLAIVYGIVKEHNGFIEVESQVGRGTTFQLYLPMLLSQESSAIDETIEVETSGRKYSGRRGTVLVVEDEKQLIRLLKRLLPRAGYRVLSAMDGEEAVDLYRNYQTEIDVVLLDLGLPKVTGLEVIPKLKEQNPDVRIVIATGYLEPELKVELLRAGVLDCVHKPYSVKELVGKLGSLIENSRPLVN